MESKVFLEWTDYTVIFFSYESNLSDGATHTILQTNPWCVCRPQGGLPTCSHLYYFLNIAFYAHGWPIKAIPPECLCHFSGQIKPYELIQYSQRPKCIETTPVYLCDVKPDPIINKSIISDLLWRQTFLCLSTFCTTEAVMQQQTFEWSFVTC